MIVFPFGLPLFWYFFQTLQNQIIWILTEGFICEYLGKVSYWSDFLVNLFPLPRTPFNPVSPTNTNVRAMSILKEGIRGKQGRSARHALAVVLLVVWVLGLAGMSIHCLSISVSVSLFPILPSLSHSLFITFSSNFELSSFCSRCHSLMLFGALFFGQIIIVRKHYIIR